MKPSSQNPPSAGQALRSPPMPHGDGAHGDQSGEAAPQSFHPRRHTPSPVPADGEEEDETLLSRMRAGDSAALAVLWRRYAALLYTQAHAVLHNPAESEDVVAEMFVEVWQRAANYHPERARPVAWLVTLVRRRAIDKLRERRSYESAGARMAKESTVVGQPRDGGDGMGGDGILEQLRLSELRAMLENALGQLPQNQRETVRMVYFQGLTQKEIAARTRTPLGTVKTRLELGLRKLRDRIRGARLRMSTSEEGAAVAVRDE